MKKIIQYLVFFLLLVYNNSIIMAAQSVSSPETVTGVVISATEKKPVKGASIRVKGTNVETSTTYSGYFSIKAQKGDTLIISCLSFEDKYVTVDNHDLRISLMPPTFFCSRIYLPEELQIGLLGEVYDQDAKPLAGATVTFLPSGKNVTTDKKGFFSISEIEEDDNIVIIKHPCYKPVKGAIDGNYFIIRLEKNIVTGIVLDEEGEPVQNAKVKDEIGNVSALTDFDGRFSINVDDGTKLTVSYPAVRSQKVVGYSFFPLTIILDFNDTVRAINLDSLSRLKPKVKTLTSNSEIAQNSIHSFTVNGVNFNMVEVAGGTFLMGATASQGEDAFDNEWPAHEVTVPSFCIGQTEVTQELWLAVMGENPSWCNGEKHYSYYNDWVRGDIDYGTNLKRPVDNVSWEECQEFINRLNKMTGKKFRLPTEAEWEFAACGGNYSEDYKYSGSNNIDDVAWNWKNCGDIYLDGYYNWDHIDRQTRRTMENRCMTHSVGTKTPNELGIYDMSGNVWEWCQDNWYNYDGSNTDFGNEHVTRGGSRSCEEKNCRVTQRSHSKADSRYPSVGLRLAL